MNIWHEILAGKRILKARFLKKRIPLIVHWSITNSCNFRCRYCNIWKREGKELSTKNIFSIISELSELGTRRIGFSGGEPLLRKDTGKIIDYCKNHDIYTTITTNGYLLGKRIRELKNLDALIVSFDGPESVHDYQRSKGSYKEVINALKLARIEGIKTFTSTVLSEKTSPWIDFILDKAEELGFHTYYQPLRRHFFAPDINGLLPSDQEYAYMIEKLIKAKREGKRIAHSLKTLKSFMNSPINRRGRCWAGKIFCDIDTDGKVYPCFDLVGKSPALNCLEVGMEKAFQNLSDIPCNGCQCNNIAEVNSLMSLNLGSVLNAIKMT